MIGELIKNYGEIGALGTLILLMAWYLIHQTKRQTKREDKHDEMQREERLFYRNLVGNDLKGLHNDSLKNADLNNQTIILQKDMMEQLKEHDGFTRKLGEKTVKALETVCDRLNGGAK